MNELLQQARSWAAQDPDQVTRAELEALIAATQAGDSEAAADLQDRFASRLAFGTAGLRGALGAGPNRMNRVLVAQAAAGFSRYLIQQAGGADAVSGISEAERPLVVIGYDGRVNSDVFAKDSAEIFAGMGLRAMLMPRMLPTPVLAFAVRHLNAAAGVMVTASHNPPQDNGYKVYLGGQDEGSQIVSPADEDIAAHILQVADSMVFTDHARGSFQAVPESVVEAYVAATAALMPPVPAGSDGSGLKLKVVYTAMHGVGTDTVNAVLSRAGYPALIEVPEQARPDGRFPTVAFPNPEEPGAMDLAFALAASEDADLIIANDPDADRLAIAIPDPSLGSGAAGWRRLTGNDVGLLLAWQAAERANAAGVSGALACSMVSSPGLGAVAQAYGLDHVETPTGFKWVSRVPGLLFGYEEALGYLVNPDDVRDKDGVSAAAAFLAMAYQLAANGQTVADRLDEFVAKFGAFTSGQVSVRVSDLSVIGSTMQRLRDQPPATIGEVAIDRIEDLATGFAGMPPADVLRMWMADGSRVMVRPSGTEPKLKVYIDVVADSGTVAERVAAAAERVAALEAGVRVMVGA